MPKRIDELTSKQKSQIDAWADKWIEIGLRTGEIDLQTFTEGTKEAYGFAGITIDGNDVMKELNIKPGPKVGQILKKIFEEIDEDLSKNNREYLLKRIKEIV